MGVFRRDEVILGYFYNGSGSNTNPAECPSKVFATSASTVGQSIQRFRQMLQELDDSYEHLACITLYISNLRI